MMDSPFLRRVTPDPAPECRVEISPVQPSKEDLFLHVLTADSSTVDSVPVAVVEESETT